MMPRRTHEAISVLGLTLHNGIDSREGSASRFKRCLIRFRRDIGIGRKEARFTPALCLLLSYCMASFLHHLNIGAIMYCRQLIHCSSTRRQESQSIAL